MTTPTEARALADLADGPLFKHTVAVALRALADQVEALEKAAASAYGYLFLVDSTPENPNRYSSELLAHTARNILLKTLTHQQRGDGIDEALAVLDRAREAT